MLTESQVDQALTDLLGYDAIQALLATADQLGQATLIARGIQGKGNVLVRLDSTTDETDPARYTLHLGSPE